MYSTVRPVFINKVYTPYPISLLTNHSCLINLPWWPSCLDRGALINVEATGCGTSVV